jgi:DNA-binding Lrp family transcriptional regulator
MANLLEKLTSAWKSRKLKSFKESQVREAAFDAKQRGTQRVPLAQIVGSVGRYHDFDRQFQPRHHRSSDRYKHIKTLLQGGVTLQPIKLYQIRDEYYVLDGNHRVSAAKALGHEEIEACIVEFLPLPTTLENILYREKTDFFEKTGLRCSIELTEVGQYRHLLNQIKQHQQFLEHEQSETSLQGAAADWYQTIYQPLVKLIERSHLLDSFPQRTPADLYAYISLHQWEIRQVRHYHREIDQLIPENMEEFRTQMAHKQESEYPEMKREITLFILMNVSAKREERIIEKLFALDEVKEIHSVHGSIDIVVKLVLTSDLLSSETETIARFVDEHVRKIPGIVNTQTLIPCISKVKA